MIKKTDYRKKKQGRIKCSYVLLLSSFLIPLLTFSQSKVQILNKEDGQSIFLAHVKFTCLSGSDKNEFKWIVSDEKGFAINPFSDTTKVDVSYVGFISQSFLLLPNEEKRIKLESSAFGLNELVVTAQFTPVETQKSVFEVKAIKEEKIIEKGANNLREALTNELNFKTNNGHVNETAINLNGLSGNHVKFMIDGVPVEGRLSGNIDLSQINLNEIEKIEIIEGPSSVAYGTNALGGVINVITKKHQLKKVDVNFKSYYESVGQYNFSGKVGFKVKRNLFKISGGRNFFAGFANQDTSRFKDWKPREQYFGSFLFSRRIHHLKLSYIFDGFTETMTSRGAPRAPYFVNAFDTHYKTKRLSNKLLLNGRLSKDNFLDVTLSQSYYHRARNIYFKDLTTLDETLTESNADQDTTIFNNYLFRGVFSTNSDSSKINFIVGTELKLDFTEAERVTNYKQEIGDYAIFGNIRYNPIKSITIQPGVRYGYNTKYTAPIVPSINFLVNLGESTIVRASYAKGFRAPDLKELYLEFHYNSTINLYGNENLSSENSDHVNLSVDFHKAFKNHKLRVVPKVYYSKINNLIDLAQTSPINWTYTNVDYLITQGASITVNYDYKNFNFNSAYSYYGNYNSQFNNLSKQNQFFYSNDASSGVGYLFDSLDLKLNLNYKYTGTIKSYYLDDDKNINESFIGDYHTFDFTATKRFWEKRIALTAGVKNLFDVKEIKMTGEVFGVSNSSDASALNVLWGRSYFVSLNLNF
jgi:outer membrane receptor for ferrienterochelin and colicins